MGKQIAVAGRLPFQRGAERLGFKRDQCEIVAARIVLGERAGELLGRREMDEAVALVVR